MRWNTARLGDVAEFVNGGAWKQSEYVHAGIPVARVSDFHNGTIDLASCKYLPESSLSKYRKHELRTGDLVIATVGSHPTQPASVVGQPVIVPPQASGALLNQNAVRISPADDRLDKRFLGYVGRSPLFRAYVIEHARGSANQVRVAIGALREMKIPLPDLSVQLRIGEVLSFFDALIENDTRRIAILEQMAEAVYREWFIDFRFPDHEQVEIVESELGSLPAGWNVIRIDEALSFQTGRTIPKEDRGGSEVPVYGANGIIGYADGDPMHPPCTILGKIGSCGSLHRSFVPCWVTNNAFSVGPNLVKSPELIWHLVGRIEWAPYIGGSANPYMPDTAFGHHLVAVAPESVQAQFENLLHPGSAMQHILRKRSAKLGRTRDLLLPKLISGEIDVEIVDRRLVEPVA